MNNFARIIGALGAVSSIVVLSIAGCGSDSGNSGGGGAGAGTTTTTSSGEETCHSSSTCDPYGGNIRCLFANGCFGDGQSCFTPGSSSTEKCTTDADCVTGFCKSCGTGWSVCQYLGCADESCDPGYTCTAEGRCVLPACQADTDCPGNFRCDTPNQICQRKTCQADADCADYCVEGFCTEKLGSCVTCI